MEPQKKNFLFDQQKTFFRENTRIFLISYTLLYEKFSRKTHM